MTRSNNHQSRMPLSVEEPPRDQYGRFALLTLPLELTPQDVATWSEETRVLVDMALDCGGAADASSSIVDSSGVALYRLFSGGDPFMWGGEWEQRDHEFRYVGDLKDPLVGLDAFDFKQRLVPEAAPYSLPTIITISAPAEFRVGDWIQIGRDRIESRGELIQHAQVASVDPATRTITLSAGPFRDHPVTLTANEPLPARPRSRVPAHVQRHRPRLDGRRA